MRIPGKYAAWLEKRAGVSDEERRRIMWSDPAGYRFLVALHLAARAWRSSEGTECIAAEQDKQHSGEWLNSTQVANLLGVTRRCITKRCASGRLNAHRLGRHWMVHSSEVHAELAEMGGSR